MHLNYGSCSLTLVVGDFVSGPAWHWHPRVEGAGSGEGVVQRDGEGLGRLGSRARRHVQKRAEDGHFGGLWTSLVASFNYIQFAAKK